MSDEQAVERRLAGRLEELEAEVLALRRELLDSHRERAQLPAGAFQILRVQVGDDLFGIPIAYVREIVRYVALTRVTDVPEVVAGAVNVRGEVFAVIDARKRFGYETARPGYRTSIVLTASRGRASGLVVDRVLDVVTVSEDSLSEPNGALASARCVAAMCTTGERMVQLVDLALLLNVREWRVVTKAMSEHPGVPDGKVELPSDTAWEGIDE